MVDETKLVRFDWAIKNILRDKANFDVLEGFLSALLCNDIHVVQLLESESNQEEKTGKYNRVDIMVKDSEGRHLIIEIQNQRETDYLERLLFGTSKVIVENLNTGEAYRHIVKVISISILYFNLGAIDDYVYYGTTEFRGMHTKQPLIIRESIKKVEPCFSYRSKDIFPEYYLINVERFEDIIQSDIDEWIYMLKHDEVRDNFRSKNIDKAKEKLALIHMGTEERKRYERYLMDLASERDIIQTARVEGKVEGIKEGKVEGIEEGIEKRNVEIAKNLLDILDEETIAAKTGLSIDQVHTLKTRSDRP